MQEGRSKQSSFLHSPSFEKLRGPDHSAFCYILTQRCRCCLSFPSGLPGILSQGKVEGIKYIWLGYWITEEGYDNAFSYLKYLKIYEVVELLRLIENV